MPRVAPIQNRDQVKPEDQKVFDTVAAVRGAVRGPSSIVLHSPALAERHVHLSGYFNGKSLIKEVMPSSNSGMVLSSFSIMAGLLNEKPHSLGRHGVSQRAM